MSFIPMGGYKQPVIGAVAKRRKQHCTPVGNGFN
jgi:hypothetical protein